MSELIMVAGAGKSGLAATKMILDLGGSVLLYDSNDSLDPAAIKDKFPGSAGLKVRTGELRRSDIDGVMICVMSPGIDLETPFVRLLENANIPLWSEVQLAFTADRGTLVAITGTNGKTTTTALAGSILRHHYDETFVAGNIGIPYTETVLSTTENSVTVLETSSFQLETITDFRPHVSAILNITPDHLNRHHSMENYISIKESITANQTENDYVILNYEDSVLRDFGTENADLRPRVIWFSSGRKLQNGFFLSDGIIYRSRNGMVTEFLPTDQLKIIGTHNYENTMAAMAIAECMGVPDEEIRKACREFSPVEHRIEFVRERAGVKYYNDSKGTNPDASIRAVEAMPGPTLLIAGGYDKNAFYDDFVKSFQSKVKHVVLIGATRDAIAACCKKYGYDNVMYAESMDEAVKVCASYADIGDCVLLSPACASWDMYSNYEERGKDFKKTVYDL